jgi:hypothetical protein
MKVCAVERVFVVVVECPVELSFLDECVPIVDVVWLKDNVFVVDESVTMLGDAVDTSVESVLVSVEVCEVVDSSVTATVVVVALVVVESVVLETVVSVTVSVVIDVVDVVCSVVVSVAAVSVDVAGETVLVGGAHKLSTANNNESRSVSLENTTRSRFIVQARTAFGVKSKMIDCKCVCLSHAWTYHTPSRVDTLTETRVK